MKKLLIGTAIVLALTFGFASVIQSDVTQIGVETKDSIREVTILINNEIGQDATAFLKATKFTTGTHYRIVIMTPGGNADHVIAIMNQIQHLQRFGAKVTTESSVLCHSGGAYIWIMGDERVAHKGDTFMFHEAVWYNQDGTPYSLDGLTPEMKESLRQTNNTFRQKLLNSIGDNDIVKKLLNPKGNRDDGTNMNWFTADEMNAMGLVHKLYE